jgi:hypothetical protein
MWIGTTCGGRNTGKKQKSLTSFALSEHTKEARDLIFGKREATGLRRPTSAAVYRGTIFTMEI